MTAAVLEPRVPLVVFVTDPAFELARTANVVREAGLALGPGRLLVQLRDKHADEAALLATARVLREVTEEVGARLVVNGPAPVARAARADGVHFPNAGAATTARVADARVLLGAQAFVSTTAHDDDDVRHAVRAGATAVLVSPIFDTPGKGAARGVIALRAARAIVDAARQASPTLVYALGGVSRETVAACAEAGADGVAAIRAVYEEGTLALRALAEPFARGARSRTP